MHERWSGMGLDVTGIDTGENGIRWDVLRCTQGCHLAMKDRAVLVLYFLCAEG